MDPAWTHSVLEICKACPDKSRFVPPVFWFERTKSNDDYFRENFDDGKTKLINGEQQKSENEFLTAARPSFKYLTTPDPDQQIAIDMARKKVSMFAFFEKPGFGKTKTMLDHVVWLWCEGIIDNVLIFAPNIVHEQWLVDEVPKHVHYDVPVRPYVFSSKKKLSKDIMEEDSGALRMLAMNHESVHSKTGEKFWRQFVSTGRTAIIIDESHKIKNHSSVISKKLYDNRYLFDARFIATGTPDPQGLHDYFAQMRFLDPNIIGSKSWQGFKSRHCVMGGFENKEIRGYLNSGELHKKMAPYVHVGAPVIDAKKIYEDSKFTLPDNVRKIYDELAEDFLLQMEDGSIVRIKDQLSALIRLHQLTCGRLILEDGTIKPVHSERKNLLKSLLDRFEGMKVIIWNRFTYDMDEQLEMLGGRAVGYWGKHSSEDRRGAISSFLNPKGGAQYLVASPAAAGTGLNLQGTCFVNIYYSHSDVRYHREQSEYRTYRRGVDKNVLFIDMAARRTVDLGFLYRNRSKGFNSQLSYNEFKELINGDMD